MAAFFTFIFYSPGFAQTQTPSDGVPLPDPSRTTRDDATALETNPAGLGFMRTTELGYGFYLPKSDLRGIIPEGHAIFLAAGSDALGGGLGIQWVQRPGLGGKQQNYRKYTLALGRSFGNISAGSALNWFGSSTSEHLDDLIGLDFGLQWRASHWLGLGFSARDLNNGFLSEFSSLPMRYGLSAALRFFDGRLIFENGFDSDSRSRFVRLSPRLVIEPIDGIRLFSHAEFLFNRTDDTASFDFNQVGVGVSFLGSDVRANLSKVGFDGQVAYEGWGGYLSISPNKQRLFSLDNARSWVLIDLNETFLEQKKDGVFGDSAPTFLDLVNKLQIIEKDEDIEGVILMLGQSNFSWAQAWEIRKLVENLRKAGKASLSYVSNPTLRQYYIASAAKDVWITPDNTFALGGIRSTTLNAGKAIASTGIEAQFVRIGKFKAAPELFTEDKSSDSAEQQKTAYIDTFYSEALNAIAASRNVSVAKVKALINSDGLFPDEVIAQGWAEKVVYADEADRVFHTQVSAHLQTKYPKPKTREERWNKEPIIAVVAIDGDIVSGESQNVPFLGQQTVGHKSIIKTLLELAEDDRVKGVVVRVNSPGGSASASDQIYRAMRRLAQQKPVITSMGGVTASGGYYVAAGADEIYAAPTTITGSIGIFTGNFNANRLMKKLGINRTTTERGNPVRFSIYESWSEKEIASIKRNLNYLYRLFLTQIAANRPLSIEQIDKVARGHVWSGKDAKKVQLVDTIGGLADAINRVRELSNLGDRGVAVQYGSFEEGLQESILGINVFGSEKTEMELARALILPFRDFLKVLLTFEPGEALMLFEERMD